jgi:hypothetical protein
VNQDASVSGWGLVFWRRSMTGLRCMVASQGDAAIVMANGMTVILETAVGRAREGCF